MNICFQSLSPQQKKEWDQRAKEERRLRKNENGDMRLDNIGEIIGVRIVDDINFYFVFLLWV